MYCQQEKAILKVVQGSDKTNIGTGQPTSHSEHWVGNWVHKAYISFDISLHWLIKKPLLKTNGSIVLYPNDSDIFVWIHILTLVSFLIVCPSKNLVLDIS